MSERKYVDKHGEPRNEKGELLVPELGTTSPAYAELDSFYMDEIHQLTLGNYTDPPIAEAIATVEGYIARLTDRGEIEEANTMLDDLRDAKAKWESAEAAPDTRSPELREALRIIYAADEAEGTEEERLAIVTRAMKDSMEAVRDAHYLDQSAVRRHLPHLERYADALEGVIERRAADRPGEADGRPQG